MHTLHWHFKSLNLNDKKGVIKDGRLCQPIIGHTFLDFLFPPGTSSDTDSTLRRLVCSGADLRTGERVWVYIGLHV